MIEGEPSMSQPDPQSSPLPSTAFEQAGQEPLPSLAREFWLFITENKKWWMIPILLVMSLVGLLVFISTTGLLPFVYSVF
jgi:hypothetical protein